jgi:hypothetical protein
MRVIPLKQSYKKLIAEPENARRVPVKNPKFFCQQTGFERFSGFSKSRNPARAVC